MDTCLIYGHRGASAEAPENTIEAFELAVAQGADGIELDVRLAADGTLAVHHDPELADGRAIAVLGRPELPTSVPDLAAALDTCAGLMVNIEIKNFPNEAHFDSSLAVVDAVVAALRARNGRDRVIISCFHHPTLERMRLLAPDLATAYLTFFDPGWAEAVDVAVAAGHRAIHPNHHEVDTALVEGAHAAGLAVNTWTVDDVARIRELAAMGVDGIVTNTPGAALAALGRA